MNLSEKNNHFKKLIQLKVGVGPESELESDNRNCPESESALESDGETSDSTALVSTPTNPPCVRPCRLCEDLSENCTAHCLSV